MKTIPYLYALFVAIALVAGGAPVANGQDYLTNGLIAYYPFNGSGNDESGNAYNATLINCLFATNRLGAANASCKLNGTNGFAILPSLSFGSQFTFSAWFQFDALSGRSFQRVFDFGNGVGVDNIILCQDTTTTAIRFELDGSTASPGNSMVKTPAILQTGRFYQAVCVLTNGNTMTLYLNGELVGSQNLSFTYRQNTRTNNFFGKSNWAVDSLFKGSIDDVRIYNRALSPSEVQQLYQAESGLLTIETAAVRLRWFAEPNVTYQVQWSPDFQSWSNLALIFGMGLETNYVDWTDGPRKFYRVTTP